MSIELNEVFGSLNLSDEAKAKIEAGALTPETFNEVLEDHNSRTFATRLEAKQNDPEFIKPYKDQGYKEAEGKFKGTWEQQMSQIFPDISPKDDQGMRPFKDVLTDLKTIMESKQKPDEKLKEMQDKLLGANQRFETLNSQIESGDHPAISALRGELETLQAQRAAEDHLRGLKSVLPENLTIPADDAAFLLDRKLSDRSLKGSRNESGVYEIKTPEGLFPNNEKGTEAIKDARVLAAVLMADYVKKSNGNQKTTTDLKPDDPKITTLNPKSHFGRVNKAMEEQAKRHGVTNT